MRWDIRLSEGERERESERQHWVTEIRISNIEQNRDLDTRRERERRPNYYEFKRDDLLRVELRQRERASERGGENKKGRKSEGGTTLSLGTHGRWGWEEIELENLNTTKILKMAIEGDWPRCDTITHGSPLLYYVIRNNSVNNTSVTYTHRTSRSDYPITEKDRLCVCATKNSDKQWWGSAYFYREWYCAMCYTGYCWQ